MKKEKSLLLLMAAASVGAAHATPPVSYTHLRAHETR